MKSTGDIYPSILPFTSSTGRAGTIEVWGLPRGFGHRCGSDLGQQGSQRKHPMDRYSQLKATETLQVPETIEAFDGVSFFLVNEKQAKIFFWVWNMWGVHRIYHAPSNSGK